MNKNDKIKKKKRNYFFISREMIYRKKVSLEET